MEETHPKTTKPRTKPSASSPATTKSAAAVKRASETDRDPKDSKRGKNKDLESDGVVEKSEDTKKQLFQRLWSEDDEIAVLKGIIDFTEKKGVDPAKDMSSFYDFIKKSLHFDVSLSQLKDKVWRLKKKFENHIWGSEATSGGGVDLGVKSNGKAKGAINSLRGKSLAALKAELGVDVEKETEKVDKMEVELDRHSGLKQTVQFDKSASVGGMEEYVVKRGLDMLEGSKKAEMEEKWRQLHVAELELFLKRNELIRAGKADVGCI
ncbi:hypothetical protein GH714_004831 [Hevea brasiliensis]|uniref:Uncharacterized protein n=1 Tax=Hevea brasiliensis TaxID=3981 RepID=A0A6A6LIC5_HEVBR|nr:hypothetical protein GH714_004831 [Hevea brasiliensis]